MMLFFMSRAGCLQRGALLLLVCASSLWADQRQELFAIPDVKDNPFEISVLSRPWVASLAAAGPDEQVVAYGLITAPDGVRVSTDTVEIPSLPAWRRTAP
jgi:hypothetical protein